MAGQAERAALVAACERRGLVAQETGTGGGCTAIQVTVAGREWPQVLVTNGDAMVPWFFDGDNEVLAGVFVDVDDSEGTLFVDTTVAAAGVAGLADRVAAALYTAAAGGRKSGDLAEPEPVASYVIGQPVVVTVYAGGHVTFALDLSDVDRPRDVAEQVPEWSDEQVDEVCTAVDRAIQSGSFDIFRA